MKKLLTSNITATVSQPIKKRTLDHLQESHQETAFALAKTFIGDTYSPSVMYILNGCKNIATSPNFNITEGVIFFAGEIYLVDAVSFVTGVGEVAVCKITETFAAEDPTTFTDGNSHSVHSNKKIVISSGVSGSGDMNFSNLFNVSFETPAWNQSSSTASCTITTATGTFLSVYRTWRKDGNLVILNVHIAANITVSGSALVVTVPLPVDVSVVHASAGFNGSASLQVASTQKLCSFQLDSGANTVQFVSLQSSGTGAALISAQIMYEAKN